MKRLLQKFARWVSARYEAAVIRWGDTSWLYESLQDAHIDIDKATREELQRKHRYWVKNSALTQRIRNLFIQFSVGVSGLQVVPNSENEDWNHSRQASWQMWGREPEINSRSTLAQCCSQWAGALFDDGEYFVFKTRDALNQPKIQTIEAHRVETPPDYREDEGKTIFDGVRVDGAGRPMLYYVRDTQDKKVYRKIPADQMIHLFKVRRPGQMRGIPEGFSCLNTLHDYEDLHLLEMAAAKLASEIGNVETNSTGELDTRGTRRLRLDTTTNTATGTLITKNTDQFYKVKFGTRNMALKAGDSLKQFQIDRPSIATQQYWDLLISEICCGYNVPKLLVVPYSLQGTVTRADLDICANAFRTNFEIIAWGLQQIYEWQTGWAVKFDRSLDGPLPLDPLECVIRPPRAPNVDIGYTAQALALELALGVKTIQDVYAERQQDWRVQLRQIAEAKAYVNQLAKEFGIEPQEIMSNPQAAPPAPEPDSDDAEELPIKEAA